MTRICGFELVCFNVVVSTDVTDGCGTDESLGRS